MKIMNREKLQTIYQCQSCGNESPKWEGRCPSCSEWNTLIEIPKRSSRKGFINNISVGSIVGAIIFLELLVVVGGWKYKDTFVPLSATNLNLDLTNTHALGNILYTDYIHLFQISGITLLVAMIGAITLTFNKRENIKRQSYFDRIQRKKESK